VTQWDNAKRIVVARDGGKCLRCWNEAADVHHRCPKKMGGTQDSYIAYGLANLASLCRECHDWVHAHPEEGYRTGYLVHSWDDPADVPLVLGTHWIKLRSDGEFERTGEYALF
jgi:5-methylcytosine-specific restriction endonuclease McrA